MLCVVCMVVRKTDSTFISKRAKRGLGGGDILNIRVQTSTFLVLYRVLYCVTRLSMIIIANISADFMLLRITI